MFWHYTRRDSKVLLLATLCTFSAYGLMLADSWREVVHVHVRGQEANSVSVFAAVPPNELNARMAELDEREQGLTVREAALKQANTDERTILFVTAFGIALLGLILMNFYLDSKRRVRLA